MLRECKGESLTLLREWAGWDLRGLEHFRRILKAKKKSIKAERDLEGI